MLFIRFVMRWLSNKDRGQLLRDMIPVIILGVLLTLLTYGLERSSFGLLMALYTAAFGCYLWIIKQEKWPQVHMIILCGALLRLLLVFAWPNLTDDYHRFVWDGMVANEGISPYDHKPSELKEQFPDLTTTYEALNSPDYYTVYPPVNQAVFALSTLTGKPYISVVSMKMVMWVAECATMCLLVSLLRSGRKDERLVMYYAFNPLIILEFCGNLHFEALAILFVLSAVYWLNKKKVFPSVISMALAVCTKLNPLLFLPYLVGKKPLKIQIVYIVSVGGVSGLFFLFFYTPDMLPHIAESVQLYFGSFEFNAGPAWLHYRYESVVLKIVLNAAFLAGAWVIYRKTDMPVMNKLFWVYLIYLLVSQSVHPWYIGPLLAFALFTRYRFAYLWSYLIFFTYITYSGEAYEQNRIIIAVEYFLVGTYAVYEWLRLKRVKRILMSRRSNTG